MNKIKLDFLLHYFDQNYHPFEIRKDSVVRIVNFQTRLRMAFNGALFAGLFFLSGTVFFVFIFGRMMDFQSMFYEIATPGSAVITKISDARYSENDNVYMEYAFTYEVNGESFEGKSYEANGNLKEGDKVIVLYSKDNPKISKILGMRRGPATLWLILFFIPFLAVSITLIIQGLRLAWQHMLFIRYGEIAQVNIINIKKIESGGETATYSDDVSVEFETKNGEKISTVINVPSFVRSRHTNSIRILYLPIQPSKGIFYKSIRDSELRIIENRG